MRGLVTPIVLCSLAAAPAALAIVRMKARTFLVVSATLVGMPAVAGYVAVKDCGWGLTENLSTSLSGHIYVHKSGEPIHRGDLAAFHWHGGASYPAGTIFIKEVVGVPGDVVVRQGRQIWVAGHYVGFAKTRSLAGYPLVPAEPGVIPPGQYFMATPNPDSLDSRYALTGNIKPAELIGRAYAIF